jgi:non-homologous end joining protein Ku
MSQRIVLSLGGVEGEVTLTKQSAKPRDAQPETWVEGEEGGKVGGYTDSADWVSMRPADPMADDEDDVEPASRASGGGGVPESSRRRGVTLEDGTRVDLTDRLAAIDESTLLKGMHVDAAVPRSSIPSSMVRDAHYVTPAGAGAPLFLAHLWKGMRESRKALVVRWSKRKNQALGVLVARGSTGEAWIELLELEWRENLRQPPRGTMLPVEAVPDRNAAAAAKAIRAYMAQPVIFDELRDQRQQQRAELLESARRQVDWSAPEQPEQPADVEALGRLLAGQAA